MADPRDRIDELIAAGSVADAARELAALWRQGQDAAKAAFVTSRFERIQQARALPEHRIAILRSFTVEPMIPFLRAGAFVMGVNAVVRAGDFNAYAQEILMPESWLGDFDPDTVILALDARDIAPELWGRGSPPTAAVRERVFESFAGWLAALRRRSRAHVIVHNLEQPAWTSRGLLDAQTRDGQREAIRGINAGLTEAASKLAGVYVLDYDQLTARHGRERWHDEQKWLTVRLPVAAPFVGAVAQEWVRFLYPICGRLAKAAVFDLDNTIWGGIVGEDGIEGLKLGPEYPGAAYQEMQRALLDLYHRGILLAVCSKNNLEDAMEAIEKHPGMLLRREQLAAWRINWNEKAANLREIAAELNIGVDALAFVDDNPVERQQVALALPEVQVVELAEKPLEFARAVRSHPAFERLVLSDEDRDRPRYYARQREIADLESRVDTREDFLRSLEQEVEIVPLEAGNAARVAQLTQKTNQFNLTTRRYSEAEVRELASRAGWNVAAMRVRDRFQDNGLVGVAITADAGDVCRIDTFLLSCRVINRTVETALLAQLAGEARRRGQKRLEGWYLPTKKNVPCRDFYERHGFRRVEETAAGTRWEMELGEGEAVRCPEWIKVRVG